MAQTTLTLQVGQPVHRPFAFLLGQRLDGRIQDIHPSDCSSCSGTAQVRWPCGEVTEELLEDLQLGAHPPVPNQTWLQRLLPWRRPRSSSTLA